ncbi:hypothetical protein [Sinomonas susongensis]|uniref:hypothetical protein n=1 Tax=Sinomonas susongensis TaxID=1324851 RepID=UPI0011091A49|nr:hypothetical protein [Sinomonas susongensis]
MELVLPHPGPWLTSQLNDRFGSSKAADRLLEARTVVRIRRGAYYEATAWARLSPDDRHLMVLTAHYEEAARRQEPVFAYSHISAARLHGLHLWNADDAIHVTRPKCPGRSARAEDVRSHGGILLPSELHTQRGLPATTLERTLVDSARILRGGQAQILLDHGLRLGADRQAVDVLLASAGGKRGIRTARAAWELASELCESPGESLLRYLLSLMPFEMPDQQVEVSTRLGRYRLDFAWVKLKVGLEFDGDVKYFAYEPTGQALLRERKRERALMEEGWVLLRIEWRDLFDETVLRRRIAAVLKTAA